MRIILLLLVLAGCVQKKEYPVKDLDLGPDYYINLLNDVNEEVERADKSSKSELLYKKLFISQQLRWPDDVTDEIKYLIENEGLDYELYQYSIDFYESNHYYERLLNLVTKWLSQHQATSEDIRAQIVALAGLNRENEAKHLLWDFLQTESDSEGLKFIASQYLHFKDTARALYAYSRLARLDPQEKTLKEKYIPLLVNQGYPERARDLLLLQSTEDEESQELMAQILYDMGEPRQAIAILRSQQDPEDYLQVARWYQSMNAYDSALYYTDKVIEMDSARNAILIKGDIYEQRGWLNSAYTTFNALVQQNPADSIAIARAEDVSRKIAYLQKKRDAEQSLPVLEPIKKSTDNE